MVRQGAGRPRADRGRPARGDAGRRPRGGQRPRRELRDHQRPERHRPGPAGGRRQAGLDYDSAEVSFVPEFTQEVDAPTAEKLFKIIDALEDSDDVQNVYSQLRRLRRGAGQRRLTVADSRVSDISAQRESALGVCRVEPVGRPLGSVRTSVRFGSGGRCMRVLGIDPGLTRCGLGVVDGVPGRPPTLVARRRRPHPGRPRHRPPAGPDRGGDRGVDHRAPAGRRGRRAGLRPAQRADGDGHRPGRRGGDAGRGPPRVSRWRCTPRARSRPRSPAPVGPARTRWAAWSPGSCGWTRRPSPPTPPTRWPWPSATSGGRATAESSLQDSHRPRHDSDEAQAEDEAR